MRILAGPRSAEEQPLYLVDDEPVEEIGSIDPSQIERITVLKAPEAVAPYLEKYGDRAKNGVVLIWRKSSADKQTSYFERDEWKQAQEQVAQVSGSFQSEEWKAAQKKMKKLRKQFAAQKKQFAANVEKFQQRKAEFEERKAEFEQRKAQFQEQQARSEEEQAE